MLALATDDLRASRRLLDEGEALLARGCVSHNHLEFPLFAIEVSLRAGDHAEALRHAAELEAYTRAEPLPWVDAGAASDSHPDLSAVLETAQRMQFEMLGRVLLQPAAS